MYARLFCKTGEPEGEKYIIAEEATIGKMPDNTIQLRYNLISREHARIYFDKQQGCYFITDLNSRNGTRLDGRRVRQAEKLDTLHVITFARKFDFIFQVVNKEIPSNDVPEALLAKYPKPLESSPGGQQKPQPGATVVDPNFSFPSELSPEPKSKQPAADPGNMTVMDQGFQFPDAFPDPAEEKPPAAPDPGNMTVMDEGFQFPDAFPDPAEEKAAKAPEAKPAATPDPGNKTVMDEGFQFPDTFPDPAEEKAAKASEAKPSATPDSGNKTVMDEGFQFPDTFPDSPPAASDDKTVFDVPKVENPPDDDRTVFQAVPPAQSTPEITAALEIQKPGLPPEILSLKWGKNTLGRLADCDITVKERSISRQHANINIETNKLTVEDLGSANGTFVNGERIREVTTLTPGSQIRFGMVNAKLVTKK